MVSTRQGSTTGQQAGPSSIVPPPLSNPTMSSTSAHFPAEYKSRKANWDNIDKLQGSKDYDDWSHQVSLLLSALHLDRVVLEGIKPHNAQDTIVYHNMVCDAL